MQTFLPCDFNGAIRIRKKYFILLYGLATVVVEVIRVVEEILEVKVVRVVDVTRAAGIVRVVEVIRVVGWLR